MSQSKVTISVERLGHLKRLAQEATPGPWFEPDDEHVSSASGNICTPFCDDDSRYIAACSPDTIMSLLALVENLERYIEELPATDETLYNHRNALEVQVSERDDRIHELEAENAELSRKAAHAGEVVAAMCRGEPLPYERGRTDERAAVVAWLYRQVRGLKIGGDKRGALTVESRLCRIERGEHGKEQADG